MSCGRAVARAETHDLLADEGLQVRLALAAELVEGRLLVG
jgi:hypothetical protein